MEASHGIVVRHRRAVADHERLAIAERRTGTVEHAAAKRERVAAHQAQRRHRDRAGSGNDQLVRERSGGDAGPNRQRANIGDGRVIDGDDVAGGKVLTNGDGLVAAVPERVQQRERVV